MTYISERLSVCAGVCVGENDGDDDWEQALIDEYIALQEEQTQGKEDN